MFGWCPKRFSRAASESATWWVCHTTLGEVFAPCFSSGRNKQHEICIYIYMGVSKNGGFPPKSSIVIGFSIINHTFWGTPTFWKHPYVYVYIYMCVCT